MSVTLSITGGTLSTTTATISNQAVPKAVLLTVTQSGAGNATTVTLGTRAYSSKSTLLRYPDMPLGVRLSLFSSGAGPPVVTGTAKPDYNGPPTQLPKSVQPGNLDTVSVIKIRQGHVDDLQHKRGCDSTTGIGT